MPDRPTILYRVDPRLVHATLMNAWVPKVGAQQILVVDDALADDPRRRNIVEIAAMDVGRLLISTVAESAPLLEQLEGNTIVLFSSLGGAEAAYRHGLKMSVLNVGHVPAGADRTEYLPAIYLGSDELAVIGRLQGQGVQVQLQSLPDDEPVIVADPTTGARPAADESAAFAEGEFEVVNERGLHLRAAHVLAALCNRFSNHIEIGREGYMVNGKSLLGLTALGAAAGTRLKVVVTGPDASKALTALQALFASGFEEGVAPGMGGSG